MGNSLNSRSQDSSLLHQMLQLISCDIIPYYHISSTFYFTICCLRLSDINKRCLTNGHFVWYLICLFHYGCKTHAKFDMACSKLSYTCKIILYMKKLWPCAQPHIPPQNPNNESSITRHCIIIIIIALHGCLMYLLPKMWAFIWASVL